MEAWQLIVILGIVIIAIAFLRPEQQLKGTPENITKEMEEAIGYIATDLDEQNGRLLELFSEMKLQYESQTNKLLGRIESLEKQGFFLQQQMLSELSPHTITSEIRLESNQPESQSNLLATAPTMPPHEPAEKDPDEKSAPLQMNIKERYSRIFELYQEGKSIEYVAKKLGMNKGEVQLIVQLSRQEEQFRV